MSEILTPDRIAALVDAAKQGQLPEAGGQRTQRRSHRLRTVDFSRPTKFSADHQRRISRGMETFCQTAVTRLSTELRCPVELELLNTAQLTWAAAQTQVPSNSLSVLLEVEPIGTRMLMTAEQPFVLTALECLLGGSPDRPPRERRLSEIDWSLTRRLFESLINPLSLVWHELGGVTLSAGDIEVHDASQVASVSEPTFTILLEARIAKQSFALGLLIPWVAIEPVVQAISGRADGPQAGELDASPMHRAMSAVPVRLRAEVAAIDMPVRDILGLAPGSVIKFGAPADDGVMLFAENVKLARAQPGSHGPRRAVQICGGEGHTR
ncbi:MAG TPA: FliM/FliN family flagellar motor switch protein [Solirubrobacteraceae bacterium]|nr:FliM/FliN family flagellar motor switch protein [Solirubrobacteraceae bacterium]